MKVFIYTKSESHTVDIAVSDTLTLFNKEGGIEVPKIMLHYGYFGSRNWLVKKLFSFFDRRLTFRVDITPEASRKHI